MIPQAIANMGPYADLWSHLKSMQHALQRALAVESTRDITDLDKERLLALSQFLKSELIQKPTPEVFSFAGFGRATAEGPSYSLDLDLHQIIKALPDFEQWHAAQKLGFEKKWQKLITTLESYIQNVGGNWLPNQPPKEEFQILQKIISELLLHAESTLQS